MKSLIDYQNVYKATKEIFKIYLNRKLDEARKNQQIGFKMHYQDFLNVPAGKLTKGGTFCLNNIAIVNSVTPKMLDRELRLLLENTRDFGNIIDHNPWIIVCAIEDTIAPLNLNASDSSDLVHVDSDYIGDFFVNNNDTRVAHFPYDLITDNYDGATGWGDNYDERISNPIIAGLYSEIDEKLENFTDLDSDENIFLKSVKLDDMQRDFDKIEKEYLFKFVKTPSRFNFTLAVLAALNFYKQYTNMSAIDTDMEKIIYQMSDFVSATKLNGELNLLVF